MIERMENFFFTTLRGYFATLPFWVGQHGMCGFAKFLAKLGTLSTIALLKT